MQQISKYSIATRFIFYELIVSTKLIFNSIHSINEEKNLFFIQANILKNPWFIPSFIKNPNIKNSFQNDFFIPNHEQI